MVQCEQLLKTANTKVQPFLNPICLIIDLCFFHLFTTLIHFSKSNRQCLFLSKRDYYEITRQLKQQSGCTKLTKLEARTISFQDVISFRPTKRFSCFARASFLSLVKIFTNNLWITSGNCTHAQLCESFIQWSLELCSSR